MSEAPVRLTRRTGLNFPVAIRHHGADTMTSSPQSTTLFVWRRSDRPGWLDLGPEGVGPSRCPICTADLHRAAHDEWDDDYVRTPVALNCPLCGWSIVYVVEGSYTNAYQPLITYSISAATLLREFPLSSSELTFEELAAFLRSQPQFLHELHWRRFEALVADVYGQHGYRTVLTQASKDGGADVVVLHRDADSATAIIECKRFTRGRPVGVSLVRALVGAAVSWDVRRATLVTTSDFTADARISAHAYRAHGFEIDLVAAADLVTLLGVYNPNLPPLGQLTDEDRRYIAHQNRQLV
jgi:hypothetical protein